MISHIVSRRRVFRQIKETLQERIRYYSSEPVRNTQVFSHNCPNDSMRKGECTFQQKRRKKNLRGQDSHPLNERATSRSCKMVTKPPSNIPTIVPHYILLQHILVCQSTPAGRREHNPFTYLQGTAEKHSVKKNSCIS